MAGCKSPSTGATPGRRSCLSHGVSTSHSWLTRSARAWWLRRRPPPSVPHPAGVARRRCDLDRPQFRDPGIPVDQRLRHRQLPGEPTRWNVSVRSGLPACRRQGRQHLRSGHDLYRQRWIATVCHQGPRPGAGWIGRRTCLGLAAIVDVMVDPRNRDTVYVVTQGVPGSGANHVLKSTDAGQTWTDITNNMVDIPGPSTDIPLWKVVIDPRDGTLYLGSDQGVWRLKNGSGSWDRFRRRHAQRAGQGTRPEPEPEHPHCRHLRPQRVPDPSRRPAGRFRRGAPPPRAFPAGPGRSIWPRTRPLVSAEARRCSAAAPRPPRSTSSASSATGRAATSTSPRMAWAR